MSRFESALKSPATTAVGYDPAPYVRAAAKLGAPHAVACASTTPTVPSSTRANNAGKPAGRVIAIRSFTISPPLMPSFLVIPVDWSCWWVSLVGGGQAECRRMRSNSFEPKATRWPRALECARQQLQLAAVSPLYANEKTMARGVRRR